MNFVQGRFDILKPPVTILRFYAVKDAFTNASIPTLNYGDTHDLLTGPSYESFIGFDLSGLPEQEFIYSKLVLTLPGGAKPSEIPLEIHKLSSDQPWTETGITHANRPRDTSLLYTLVPEGTKVEVDLQGSFEEVYVLKSEELYRFFSKESGKGPYIEVAFIDPDAFREIEGRYLQVTYTAQRPVNSDFKLEWDGTLPYGESAFCLSYELSNIFLLTYAVDPKFIVSFAVQRAEDIDFSLSFTSRQRSTNDFGLSFTAVGHGENLFGFDFIAAEFLDRVITYEAMPTDDFQLSFGARDKDESDFRLDYTSALYEDFILEYQARDESADSLKLEFGAQDKGESDFVLEYTPSRYENFALEYQARDENVGSFKLSFDARDKGESGLLLDYDVISREDFLLTFTSEATEEVEFGLEFAARGVKDADLPLEFEGVPISEFLVEFTATGVGSSDFSLEYDALQRYMSDFVIEFVVQTRTSSDIRLDFEVLPYSNFTLDFKAQIRDEANLVLNFDAQRSMNGVGEFLISFTPRQTSSAEVSLEFEAMPAKSFGIEFTAQGHEVLDITLEWEALQRYFSDLRLEWVAGGSAEGEGAELVVVLHESGCLKVLDVGVLVQGILITDTDDALLEQVVLQKVEDSDGFRCHFGLK